MTFCSTSIKEYTNGLATTFGKFQALILTCRTIYNFQVNN